MRVNGVCIGLSRSAAGLTRQAVALNPTQGSAAEPRDQIRRAIGIHVGCRISRSTPQGSSAADEIEAASTASLLPTPTRPRPVGDCRRRVNSSGDQGRRRSSSLAPGGVVDLEKYGRRSSAGCLPPSPLLGKQLHALRSRTNSPSAEIRGAASNRPLKACCAVPQTFSWLFETALLPSPSVDWRQEGSGLGHKTAQRWKAPWQ